MVSGDPFEGADRPLSEKEERIARQSHREMIRVALRSTAAFGCYAFDELATDEAGTIDFVVVNPFSVCVVVVREDRGFVSSDREAGELFIDGQRFADDPRQQAQELGDDLMSRLPSTNRPFDYLICFTRAEFKVVEDSIPSGTTPVWDLAWTLDLREDQEPELTPADIEEVAEEIERVYGRPPFVRPEDHV